MILIYPREPVFGRIKQPKKLKNALLVLRRLKEVLLNNPVICSELDLLIA